MNELTKELLDALKYAASCLGTDGNDPIDVIIAKAEAALATPQPSADDWIPWAGGDCPVGGEVVVAVKDRNGDVDNYSKAHLYDWHHEGNSLDIIAYRVVKP